ncbi:hypothetical protein BFW01_g8956 [Lasiodiplodia theobromae]|nr:hypothetical protein BFW01_g8956 [Lasiodiplodia theobromae]
MTSHQKEALDFISQREADATPQPFSLWRRHTDTFQRQYYQNLVLGYRRSQLPDENFGGIIADEMGLGKTLTMLSAIFMSKGRGSQRIYRNVQTGRLGVSQLSTAATLVIVPSALVLENWIEEAQRFVIHLLQRLSVSWKCTGVFRYRMKPVQQNYKFLESDVVLTTYATLTSDYRRGTSTLSNVHWLRIVLDEAHSIRHQRTKQFYAVSALSAEYRWCLTGTPIQNQLDDLGALVRFLRIPMFDQPSSFQTSISRPIERGNSTGADRLRHLLKAVCIRRKKDRLNLPEPEELTQHVDMTQEETAEYSRIGQHYRQAIDDAVSGISKSKEYNGLFQAILQLRIFCNHGTLTWENSNSQTTSSSADETLALLQQTDQAICDHCSCDIATVGEDGDGQSAHFTLCSHLLCQGIVFSCWKKTIHLAGSFLAAHGISTVTVDGSMTLTERQTALERFRKDSNVNVLLMTLGTGAVGLNLTVATRIHILEPQWNPLQESQAIGRAIRLGQKKQVTVVRYIARNSVETYIQCRQSKKLYLARLGWDAEDETEEAKLKKLADLKSLLSLETGTEVPMVR